jgi:uncharacterized protein
MDIRKPLSSRELDELEEFLISDATPVGCMNLTMLDGLLTAIVIGPEVVLPSEWMTRVWGDSQGPVFKTMEQARRITGLIFCHMNSIVEIFMKRPDDFAAKFHGRRGSGDNYRKAGGWCSDFMVGVDLRFEDWQELFRGESRVLLAAVMALGTDEGIKRIEQAADPVVEREGWIELLATSVKAIHGFYAGETQEAGSKIA